eukprot:TRINITY_DN104369_c0_g1_i1.p1 TRINITY_DN104369_c0_g1~~TRINITY_DN104369_c0_g1_i1.p1  ORF type:complete len:229 (-),score=44.66 TRINITY_DN104369_c0_g1_i1:159-845(-)
MAALSSTSRAAAVVRATSRRLSSATAPTGFRQAQCSAIARASPSSGCGFGRCPNGVLTVVAPRHFSSASGSGADGNQEKKGDSKSSDQRYEETGEYDTQDHYKRVGNPISWANPTGGGTTEDGSSNKWRYVFPLGIAGILVLCLWSRRRNMRKEEEEALIGSPDMQMADTSRFSTPSYTPTYRPPPPPSADESPSSSDGGLSSQGYTFNSGGSGFSSPPTAEENKRWS